MSEFIDLTEYNPDDIPEGKVHDAGTEVNARISRVSKDIDKNGTPYIMPWFEDADDPNVEDWNDYLPLPGPNEMEKENGRRLRKLHMFNQCFDLDLFSQAYSLDDAKGQTGYQILGIGKNQDGDPTNSVKKYLVQK